MTTTECLYFISLGKAMVDAETKIKSAGKVEIHQINPLFVNALVYRKSFVELASKHAEYLLALVEKDLGKAKKWDPKNAIHLDHLSSSEGNKSGEKEGGANV